MSQENPKFELLQSQMRIWFIEEIFRLSPIYNIGGAVLFQADIREDLLEQAIVQAVSRHDGLRMQLALENGEPRQFIADHSLRSLEKVDFSMEPDPESAFQAWLKQACRNAVSALRQQSVSVRARSGERTGIGLFVEIPSSGCGRLGDEDCYGRYYGPI